MQSRGLQWSGLFFPLWVECQCLRRQSEELGGPGLTPLSP